MVIRQKRGHGIAKVLGVLGIAIVALGGGAAEVAAADAVGGRTIIYTPPEGATPATRVGGTTRGPSAAPGIAVLAPESTGRTTLAQPTLHWYSPVAIDSPVEVVIVDEATDKTIYEATLEGHIPAGVSALPLGKFRVSLRTDRDYRWSISVVRDRDQRSMDGFASGTIRRTEMPKSLAVKLNKTAAAEMPYFLAENGLWYDALAVLSVRIMRDPDDKELRAARASLLEQVGLKDAATADRF